MNDLFSTKEPIYVGERSRLDFYEIKSHEANLAFWRNYERLTVEKIISETNQFSEEHELDYKFLDDIETLDWVENKDIDCE